MNTCGSLRREVHVAKKHCVCDLLEVAPMLLCCRSVRLTFRLYQGSCDLKIKRAEQISKTKKIFKYEVPLTSNLAVIRKFGRNVTPGDLTNGRNDNNPTSEYVPVTINRLKGVRFDPKECCKQVCFDFWRASNSSRMLILPSYRILKKKFITEY